MGKLSAKEYLKQLEVLDMQINEDVLLLSELEGTGYMHREF